MKIIKVGAVWCSGCIVMKPRWAVIEKEHPWLETEYLDFDENEDKVQIYNLEKGKLPTFIFVDKENKEFLRLHGEISKEKLVKVILENKDK